MKQIEEHKVNAFYFELKEAIHQLGEAHGFKIQVQPPKYPTTMAFKIDVKGYDVDAGEDFELNWAENFLAHAKKLQIEPEFLGKMFLYKGEMWRFIGTKIRIRRYPFIVYSVNGKGKNRYMALASKTFREIYDEWKQNAVDQRELDARADANQKEDARQV